MDIGNKIQEGRLPGVSHRLLYSKYKSLIFKGRYNAHGLILSVRSLEDRPEIQMKMWKRYLRYNNN